MAIEQIPPLPAAFGTPHSIEHEDIDDYKETVSDWWVDEIPHTPETDAAWDFFEGALERMRERLLPEEGGPPHAP